MKQMMSGRRGRPSADGGAGMAHGGFASGNRLDGEVGYGLPVGSRLVGTPRVGFSTSEHGRDYRVGYGLGVLDRERLNLELGVDAHRRESPMFGGTDNGFLIKTIWNDRLAIVRSSCASTRQGGRGRLRFAG